MLIKTITCMQTLNRPPKPFTLLNGRISIQVLNKDPLREEIIGYYSNGQLHFRNFSGEQGFDGNCFGWHDNGVMCEESPYINGKLQGTLKRWHRNGLLSYEGFYDNGLQEGLHREFYDTGAIKAEKTYEKSVLNGVSKEWHSNGQIESEAYYLKGKIDGAYTRWWDNGKVRFSRQFIGGILEGLIEEWNEDGLFLSSTNVLRGQRHGKCGFRVKFKTSALWITHYYIRDVRILDDIYWLINTKKLTVQHILNMKNAEVRRICLEEFGYARFLAEMEHVVIDKDGDQELIRIKWHEREEDLCLVKVKCPSTGAFYTLRVPPKMKKVKEAIAWTFHLSEIEYNPQMET